MVVRDLKLGFNVNTIASSIVLVSVISTGAMIYKSSQRLAEVDLLQKSVLAAIAAMQTTLTAQTGDLIRLQVQFKTLARDVERGIADRFTGEQANSRQLIQDRINQDVDRKLKELAGGK